MPVVIDMKTRKQYWVAVSLAALAGWMVPSLESIRHWSWTMSILMMLPVLPMGWALYRLRDALPPVEETTTTRDKGLDGTLRGFMIFGAAFISGTTFGLSNHQAPWYKPTMLALGILLILICLTFLWRSFSRRWKATHP